LDKIKVLLVEDDESIAQMIRMAIKFEAPHILLESVEGGEECLEYIQRHGVDCILSDYQMGGMNGMELLMKLREGNNRVPFIFLTAQGSENIAREAFKSGAYDYFTKEICFAHFPRIINSIEQAVKQRQSETAAHKAQRELWTEKDKLEAILASIGDGISIQDLDFKVLYQNKAHCDLIGCHTGEYCYAAYEKQPCVCDPCPLSEAMKDGNIHKNQKSAMVNGETVYVDITASSVKDPDGNTVAGIEVVRDVTAQRRAETALAHRLKVEEAVARVSSMLASGGTVDIAGALGILGEAVSANRAYVFGLSEDGQFMDNTHEWCSPGTKPEIEKLQGIKSDALPWFMERIHNNENVIIPDVSALPEAAEAERGHFEKQDISSLAVVPMYSAGDLLGLIGFDDTTGPRAWAEDDIRLLRAASEILAAYIVRKRAEDRLRRLSLAVEQSPNMVTIASPSCTVEYVNPKFTELTGYESSEVVGRDANSLREQGEAECRLLHDTVESGSEWKGEFRLRRKNGDLFWVSASISPVRGPDGDITNYVCIQEDITDRKMAEEALRDSEERYRMLFNSGGDEVHVLQLTEEGLPGRFQEVNETACRRLGYSREEFLKLTPMDISPVDETAKFPEYMASLHADRHALFETVQLAKDGSAMPVEVNLRLFDYKGKPTVYAVARDISDRKRAEEETARLAAAVEAIADAVYVMDTRGTILYANPAFERITGHPREEVVGRTVEMLCAWKSGNDFFKRMHEASGAGGAWSGGFTCMRDDGTLQQVEGTVSPVLGPDGSTFNYVAAFKDVTEKKRLESIAESVNSMNNLGYVFASVRHEVGGPVNALKMTLGILKSNLSEYSRDTISESIGRCLEEIGRVEYLLHSLKSFNMYESPDLVCMDISSFMEKFIALVEKDFEKRGIRISAVMETGGRKVLIDPRALQQVMLNVLANAADALESAESPSVSIEVLARGRMVVINVTDNGAGMTSEQMSNLFKPFYTSKPSGTGLGLVIAKRMLNKMHGTIDISSRLGEGTVVEITLPEETADEQ